MKSQYAPQPLTEFPKGWFVVGYSADIKPGQLKRRRLFGRELVLFRTMSGKAALFDAYCPHLGAHLGHGGRIVGESIRCPFHGLCFGIEGECVSSPYDAKQLPKLNLNRWQLIERCGFLFTYFDSHLTTEDNVTQWELPLWDDSLYSKVKGGCEVMRGHPQEVLENSVDFSHLTALHGFDFQPVDVQVTEAGPVFNVVAAIERYGHLFARNRVRATYKTFLHGLGISYVDVEIPEQKFQLRLFGMVTPVDPGVIELRLAVQLRQITEPRRIHPFLGLFPKRWIEAFILHQTYRAYVGDVAKDFPIWQNKVYIPSPGPLQGNGFILRYRQWARQFY